MITIIRVCMIMHSATVVVIDMGNNDKKGSGEQ